MAYYAFLDENNIVEHVMPGIDETELIEGLDPETWYGNFKNKTCKRTSFNTKGGVHLEGKVPFRKNYAGIGYKYEESLDAFIPPKPFNSWILNEETCLWDPPVPMPDGNYGWDEATQSWVDLD